MSGRDLVLTGAGEVKVWFTARELADLAKARGLTSFPTTKRGVLKLAEREGWNDMPATVARKRPGREGGGGMEYHFSLLPERMQVAVHHLDKRALRTAAHLQAAASERRRIAAIKAAGASAKARRVMEARAEVVMSIEGYAISMGEDRAWGIARFLEAQAAYRQRQEIERRRDRGAVLTDSDLRALAEPLVLTAAEGFDLRPEVVEAANNRPRGRGPIARRTIYTWFKAWDEGGAPELVPAPTRASAALPPGWDGFMRFYAMPAKPSATEALAAYMGTVTDPAMGLTIDQVRGALKKLSSLEKSVGREGLLTLKSRMAYVQRTTEGMWPTTVYTADGKTFDAEVADPVSGRPIKPEITSILDVATRKCVGFAVSRKENVIAVTEALRNACLDHGIPAIFYTDRGPGYKNKTFDGDWGGLMARLGITKMHALPYNSQAKGLIERFNGTVWNPLAKRLPTYIGADMDKEAAKAVHKRTRREIAEVGRSRVLLDWDAFLAMCRTAIEEYNARPHSALPVFEDPEAGMRRRTMSPNEAWAAHAAAGFEPVTVAEDERDDLFRPYEERITRRALVEWNTNTYFHPDLERHHGKTVLVGYDFHQADRVWVREFDAETGLPGPLICVATFGGNKERYVPLTAQRAAEETRVKAQLRRIGKKTAAIEEQLNAPFTMDEFIRPVAEIDPVVQPSALRVVDDAPPPAAAAGARYTNPDAELAFQCIADPSQLTPGRARLLSELMGRHSGREILRLAGVDLDTLDDLLRSAA
ncbi:Mu transposase C-terminal domain-containing protein [Rhodovulum strictum]|uniref:DDE-type integrase/transposase/recombinase n=1 Tax=Rhodovulum strictum TaxID=58314 RepID=A0A844BAR4_9RHOB|nr:Mu transposase C-terminal domain-containing protein [Rhodovulum strictum]MRH22680.1 DDE-type integrase/transposase/recombinase [Rhodovulum strictum]